MDAGKSVCAGLAHQRAYTLKLSEVRQELERAVADADAREKAQTPRDAALKLEATQAKLLTAHEKLASGNAELMVLLRAMESKLGSAPAVAPGGLISSRDFRSRGIRLGLPKIGAGNTADTGLES